MIKHCILVQIFQSLLFRNFAWSQNFGQEDTSSLLSDNLLLHKGALNLDIPNEDDQFIVMIKILSCAVSWKPHLTHVTCIVKYTANRVRTEFITMVGVILLQMPAACHKLLLP